MVRVCACPVPSGLQAQTVGHAHAHTRVTVAPQWISSAGLPPPPPPSSSFLLLLFLVAASALSFSVLPLLPLRLLLHLLFACSSCLTACCASLHSNSFFFLSPSSPSLPLPLYLSPSPSPSFSSIDVELQQRESFCSHYPSYACHCLAASK